ncbi:unnamed protein product, partial [marine sediment metagenome]
VVRAATDINGRKKLPCAEAFRLAEQFGVGKLEIRRICDAHNIRISNCQLGCFK